MVEMLCYAVKGILRPTFIVDQTEDLLDLLAQLEVIRRHIVNTCYHVLRLNKSYKNDTHAREVDGFALLPDDEERVLESVSSWTRQREARKTYVSLVTWSCLNVSSALRGFSDMFRLHLIVYPRAPDKRETQRRG